MPYRSSNRQISFFPHPPSLRQAWYLFELQHQSHGDNGFFDIAAVGRVVQPIGNVLPCIPLAQFGRQMTQQLANVGKRGQVIIVGIFKGLGSLRDQFGRATETPLTQLIRGSMIAQPLYYPNPTPKNVPPRHGADRSCDQCTK